MLFLCTCRHFVYCTEREKHHCFELETRNKMIKTNTDSSTHLSCLLSKRNTRFIVIYKLCNSYFPHYYIETSFFFDWMLCCCNVNFQCLRASYSFSLNNRLLSDGSEPAITLKKKDPPKEARSPRHT